MKSSINCLVLLITHHIIQIKIEIKYKIKEQRPGGIKHTEGDSSVIKKIYKIK